MIRLALVIGLALPLLGCVARWNSSGFDVPASGEYQFGPYDGPQGYHGGVFSG